MWRLCGFLAFLVTTVPLLGRQPFYDRSHLSKVFGEARHYRIMLPPDYENSGKAYPVIYYFHGHSDRYTVEKYDDGTDTIPKMVDFVSQNGVIVVTVDGFVARDYTGFYGGTPWDVERTGGEYDFGEYFKELVTHIDSTYRTLTDRRHRATSGLSMGGYMSLFLSARFPDWIGSASAFNPGPEFFAGAKDRRVLWRPKDHVHNHAQGMVRLIRASGDFISQYHEETRDAYARANDVLFEYRQDEYHKHWATSIAETFAFHLRAFANPKLNNISTSWSYASAYPSFEVWGTHCDVAGAQPGFVYLTDVIQGGMRITTRTWAPDGPPRQEYIIRVTTAPIYSANKSYRLLDYSLKTGKLETQGVTADSAGRLSFSVDGLGHQVSFVGPGTGAQPPVLLPMTAKEVPLLPPQTQLTLPIRIYNPRGEVMKDVKIVLSSEYPTVQILQGSASVPAIESGTPVDLSPQFLVRFTSGAGYFAPVRFRLQLTYDGWYETFQDFDVKVIPEVLPTPDAVEVLDGRTRTFQVFRQRGNQGGGESIERRVVEGKGNGNGVLEPGEEATIWVKMVQGMDPFDKNNWYRCKIYTDSPWITELADLQETKQREWTGAQERTSLILLSPKVPSGTSIPLILDNESWSFHFTPDVRYGPESLYQAFQLHSRHLHRFEVGVK
jgi:hypothetical protein